MVISTVFLNPKPQALNPYKYSYNWLVSTMNLQVGSSFKKPCKMDMAYLTLNPKP